MTRTDFFQIFVIAKLSLIGMFVQGQPKHTAFAVGMMLLVLAEVGAFIGFVVTPREGRAEEVERNG